MGLLDSLASILPYAIPAAAGAALGGPGLGMVGAGGAAAAQAKASDKQMQLAQLMSENQYRQQELGLRGKEVDASVARQQLESQKMLQQQNAIGALPEDLRPMAAGGPGAYAKAFEIAQGRQQRDAMLGQLDQLGGAPLLPAAAKANLPVLRQILQLSPTGIAPKDLMQLLVMDPARLKQIQAETDSALAGIKVKNLQAISEGQKITGTTPMTEAQKKAAENAATKQREAEAKTVADLKAKAHTEALTELSKTTYMTAHSKKTLDKMINDKAQSLFDDYYATYKGHPGAKHGTYNGKSGWMDPDGTWHPDA